MKRLYVIDFDGTITKQDTLDYVAQKFFADKYEMWWEKLKNEVYTINDWLRAFEEVFDVEETDYKKALDEIEIDPGFENFIDNRDIIVLSGGFMYNIKEVLHANGIEGLEIYGNDLEFINTKKIKVSMNYFNEECRECGVCKTDIIKEKIRDFDEIIYIGDGITDVCGAQNADVIYAKKNTYLERKLIEENVKFVSFVDFDGIARMEYDRINLK